MLPNHYTHYLTKNQKVIKIVIDPGHGTKDSLYGNIGGGSTEQKLNLVVAQKLKSILENLGHIIILTRNQYDPCIYIDRKKIVMDNKPDIFISIHHDGSINKFLRGTHSFYNKLGNENNIKLSNLLSQEISNEFNIPFSYGSNSSTWFNHNLDILSYKNNKIVSSLIEIMFMTNYDDIQILSSKNYVDNASCAIARAIYKFYDLDIPEDIKLYKNFDNDKEKTLWDPHRINIIRNNIEINNKLLARKNTKYIIIHNSMEIDDNENVKYLDKLSKRVYDINFGYHYFIQKNGIIEEGRPLDVMGDYNYKFDTTSVGICLSGNFNKKDPTNDQLYSLQELLCSISRVYRIQPNNIITHSDTYSRAIGGTCGSKLLVMMDQIRSNVKDILDINYRIPNNQLRDKTKINFLNKRKIKNTIKDRNYNIVMNNIDTIDENQQAKLMEYGAQLGWFPEIRKKIGRGPYIDPTLAGSDIHSVRMTPTFMSTNIDERINTGRRIAIRAEYWTSIDNIDGYCRGGKIPANFCFDSSGLIFWCHAEEGIMLPLDSWAQFFIGQDRNRIVGIPSKKNNRYKIDMLLPGDSIYFNIGRFDMHMYGHLGNNANNACIYIGEGKYGEFTCAESSKEYGLSLVDLRKKLAPDKYISTCLGAIRFF